MQNNHEFRRIKSNLLSKNVGEFFNKLRNLKFVFALRSASCAIIFDEKYAYLIIQATCPVSCVRIFRIFITARHSSSEKYVFALTLRTNACWQSSFEQLTGFSFAIVVKFFLLSFVCFVYSIRCECIHSFPLAFSHLWMAKTYKSYIHILHYTDQWKLRLHSAIIKMHRAHSWDVKYVKCIRKYVCRRRSCCSCCCSFFSLYLCTCSTTIKQSRFISWGWSPQLKFWLQGIRMRVYSENECYVALRSFAYSLFIYNISYT